MISGFDDNFPVVSTASYRFGEVDSMDDKVTKKSCGCMLGEYVYLRKVLCTENDGEGEIPLYIYISLFSLGHDNA